MAGFTNRGKARIFDAYARNTNVPTGFKLALCTAAIAPTADTNVLTDLTEIAAGNAYTAGGQTVTRDATGFPTLTEDDAGDQGRLIMRAVAWTASGGPIPASGAGARYAVLVDNANNVIAWWDLTTDRQVSDTQTLTINSAELDLTE
jgi:hypothetical protein